ncbi:D-alanyl-D-alanine carboxypeptidase/D-alanyl-D-alanine endopeptidase [Bifidobacterium asteroides]|uniref:D-alanyl-D-alanine carboxypeptidase/D-alanyl-D-alanine-endopeptidase n=1 Tax=Bifidobacterium asteroides TaxID=1684 RepID=A0A318M256_9BIFI|nr:D-alanyl-D-alanine carboxypeptidase/D-alanyl-D-alanine-endopeptidase [Bifidobacterium asteroides]PXY82287.1 D-alanyl-D-alanine carboxypeptidase/D-alanyl-D-alanine-endopeptidase [Bifidobacterium asteroides]
MMSTDPKSMSAAGPPLNSVGGRKFGREQLGDRHQQRITRRRRTKRRWRVVLTALAAIMLVVSYACMDLADLAPGPLTLAKTSHSSIPAAVMMGESSTAAVDRPGPAVDVGQVQQLVNAFADTPGLGNAYSLVVRQADGRVLAQKNADQARQPASTMKTLTAAAAASVLDMSSQLDTEVLLNSSSSSSATLTLRGNGDMLLGAGKDDPLHVNGRAGLGTLAERTAQALRKQGIDRVALAYQDTLFGDDRMPKGIEDNNPDGIYFQESVSMAVDEARQGRTEPDADPDAGGVYLPRVENPAGAAAAVFANSLTQSGIHVDNAQAPDRIDHAQGRVLARVRSARLSEVMSLMLRNSDNSLAELFGRLTALALDMPNSPAGAVKAVTSTLSKLGVDTAGLNMADCSGLTPGSTLKVGTLADIQQLALSKKGLTPLVKGLSVVGLTGTAARRKIDNQADGLIRAKTGTLDHVTSLAGNVIRRSGGVLVFAVVVNDPEDAAAARHAVDTLVGSLDRL